MWHLPSRASGIAAAARVTAAGTAAATVPADRAVSRLHVPTHFRKHFLVGFDCAAGGREHVPRYRSGTAGLESSAAVFGKQFSSSRQSYVRLGVHEAEHGEGAENLVLGKVRLIFERSARNRHQGVYRNRADFQFRERERHVDSVVESLAHAYYAAGADAEAFLLRGLYRIDFHVERVRRADVGEIPPGSLDVVVVARHPGFPQPPELLPCQKPHRGAEVDFQLALHPSVA